MENKILNSCFAKKTKLTAVTYIRVAMNMQNEIKCLDGMQQRITGNQDVFIKE